MRKQKLNMSIKTFLIALSIVSMSSVSSFAQNFGRINGGLELALPVGNFGSRSSVGGGFSIKYENDITPIKNLTWTASVGYLGFGSRNNYYQSYSIVPIQGGVKYYLNQKNQGIYGSAELGFSILSANNDNNPYNNNNYYYYNSTTYVSFAPGIGYQYGPFDFSGRLQLMNNFSYLSFRAAYVFDLNRFKR